MATTKKMKTKRSKVKKTKPKRKEYFHRECHLCLANIEDGREHVCIPRTEGELFRNLPEELRDAFQALRQKAQNFGDQRIYNNARAVMFARRVCYMFVRPKKSYLELCFFLPRKQNGAGLKIQPTSKTKFSHTYKLVHADQVETPLTDWLKEAFDFSA